MVTYLDLARRLGDPLINISNQSSILVSSLAGAERIFHILDLEKEENEIKDPYILITENGEKYWKNKKEKVLAKGKIEFEDVDFSYSENAKTLEKISFYAKPSQKIALVGATGSRKNNNWKFN